MKKILIALALVLSVTMVSAQPKTAEDAKKAVDKALQASQDPKKATKPATWFALAQAYVNAYDQPTRNVLPGTPQAEIKLFLKDQQVLGSSEVKGPEAAYTVDSYADKNLYYNGNGILEFSLVTKPAVEGDLLGEAEKALQQTIAVDPKDSKIKEIEALYKDIHNKYTNDAISYYCIGEFNKAADLFEKASLCSETAKTINQFDGTNTYYTALVSQMGGNLDKAVKYYKKCIAHDHFQEGSVFSNLADVYRQQADTVSWKATLEEGFAKYPQSQGVLVGLINLYRESGENPAKVFDLIHAAQQNEPENASLYYVEGDVYKQLGDVENAAKLYYKSFEVNPQYVYGILSVGVLYYENAIKIQDKANEEFDDTKYAALVKQMDENLQAAIEPFEKAYNTTEDPDIKRGVAEYLKNIYFRFRDKGPEYQANYEKYNDLAKSE